MDANTVDDIIKVLKNPGQYPSPVRAVGSNHSTTACGTSEGGTLIRMKMNRILNISADSITVEAGAIHIDMAQALAKQNLQFYVNTEIGNLTAGSAACCGTKDSSFPGEYGQVGSYVTGVKMVLPSGDLLEVTDAQPDLMQKVRASYGTFGIVYEVTYRIRPMLPMAVHHKTYHLAEFIQQLPQLKTLNYAMMYYLFPFEDLITVEFRSYNPGASGHPNKIIWPLRNYIWGTSGPKFARDMGKTISDPKIRYGIIDKFNALWRFKLENIITSDNTVAADEIIRYPDVANDSRYTFSLYAFPEEQFPSVADRLCQVLHRLLRQNGVPQRPARRGLSHRAGSAISFVLLMGWPRDDHRSGLDRQPWLEGVHRRLQSILQRPQRHAGSEPDLRPDTGLGQEGLRQPAGNAGADQETIRSLGPSAERLLSRHSEFLRSRHCQTFP